MKTNDVLAEAFAGESQATRRYLAFADAAAHDGLNQVAKLFRGVAAAEAIHAQAHLKASVKKTTENLELAMAEELHEIEDVYPKYQSIIEAEGDSRAMMSMKHALEAEKVHHALFASALAAVKDGHDLPAAAVRVCKCCGHTVLGSAPDRCPVCGARNDCYMEV